MKHFIILLLFLWSVMIAPGCHGLDTTAPAINIVSPEDIFYNTHWIWANVSLDEDGAWCKYSLDSKPSMPLGGGLLSWSGLLYIMDGFHNITYSCSDISGNVNQSRYHYMAVDMAPPKIYVRDYPDPLVSSSNLRFKVNCSDDVSGCNVVDISTPFTKCHLSMKDGTLYELSMPPCIAGTYDYYVNATDYMGNWNASANGTFTVKKDQGCDCELRDECMNSSCLAGLCVNAKKPSLRFYIDGPETVNVGSYRTLVLFLKNNMDLADTIRLQVSGVPEPIEYWSMFPNGETNMDVRLGPNEDVFIILKVFGGKIGTYDLRVRGHSVSFPDYGNETVKKIYIANTSGKKIVSRSPDINLYGFALAILLSLSVLQRRRLL